jgi:hypothetical protein
MPSNDIQKPSILDTAEVAFQETLSGQGEILGRLPTNYVECPSRGESLTASHGY